MSGVTPKLLAKWGFSRPVQGMKVTSIGRHHYQVSSETRPEISHVVDTSEDMPECSCENFQMGKGKDGAGVIMCKHIRRVGMLAEANLLPTHKKERTK